MAGIQSGLGEVIESVWEFIPPAQKYVEHLAQPPSRHEFDCALSKMKFGKRGGEDDVTVELIRFGNTDLKDVVFQVVLDMWTEASSADEGREASSWCSSSRSGVCIPMFKNKGSRSKKPNYRDLVMFSVSAKLVARMVASRLGKWVEEWLPDEQNGFRPRRGIDDVQQFVRRLLEEVSVSAKSGDIGFTCFDIVRAYTRVCRVALWQLLSRLGVPSAFIKILKAAASKAALRQGSGIAAIDEGNTNQKRLRIERARMMAACRQWDENPNWDQHSFFEHACTDNYLVDWAHQITTRINQHYICRKARAPRNTANTIAPTACGVTAAAKSQPLPYFQRETWAPTTRRTSSTANPPSPPKDRLRWCSVPFEG